MSAYDIRLYDLERAAIVWALGTAAGSLKCLVRSKMSGPGASPSLSLSGELFLGVEGFQPAGRIIGLEQQSREQ